MVYGNSGNPASVPGVPGNPMTGPSNGPFAPYGQPVTSPLFDFTPTKTYGGLPRSTGPWGEMGGYYGGNPYTTPPDGSRYTGPSFGFGLSPMDFSQGGGGFVGGNISGNVPSSGFGQHNPVNSPYDIDPNYNPNQVPTSVPRDQYTGEPDPQSGGDINWGSRADYWTGDGYDFPAWLGYLNGVGVPTNEAMNYLRSVYRDHISSLDEPWNATIDPFWANDPGITEFMNNYYNSKNYDPVNRVPAPPEDPVMAPYVPPEDPVVPPTNTQDPPPVSPIYSPVEYPTYPGPGFRGEDYVRRYY